MRLYRLNQSQIILQWNRKQFFQCLKKLPFVSGFESEKGFLDVYGLRQADPKKERASFQLGRVDSTHHEEILTNEKDRGAKELAV